MANARAENFPVYLAEATCNASHRAIEAFFLLNHLREKGPGSGGISRHKSKIVAVILLQKKPDYTSARAGWRDMLGESRGSRGNWLLL
jgi:hypothetical protein